MGTDFFRDTWVRYLGYANEVGEAFRPVVAVSLVRFSYKVAFGYVLADTIDKSWKTFKKTWHLDKVCVEAGDALLWQTLASVFIPGLTINRISKYTQVALYNYGKKIPPQARKVLTVGIALGCIPIIVHPIDMGTHLFMNLTYRRYFSIIDDVKSDA